MHLDIDERDRQAIATWGEQAQIDVAIEECSELCTALIHYRRNRTSAEFVAEEIADVLIMMRQLGLIFGLDNVNIALNRKRQRLIKKLDMASQESE